MRVGPPLLGCRSSSAQRTTLTADDYIGANILAPMVRVGTHPMRMLAAAYGADIVYGEELVDKKIVTCVRRENLQLGTVDFLDKGDRVIFRTCKEERGRVVFQMGTGDAVTALRCAEMVAGDVAAVDVNMGCPKLFSTHGGMGSQLLKKPETVRDILTTLRRNLPADLPVTCKIRLLETPEETAELVRVICSTGVTALGVHGRFVPQRPRDPAHWDLIKGAAAASTVPVIANGDVFAHADFQRIRDETGAQAAMCARGAMWNASIFRREGLLTTDQVKLDYLRTCIKWGSHVNNAKYCLKEMLMKEKGLANKEGEALQAAKTWPALVKLYHLDGFHASQRPPWEGAIYAPSPAVAAPALGDGNADVAHAESRKRPPSPSDDPTGSKASCMGTNAPWVQANGSERNVSRIEQ